MIIHLAFAINCDCLDQKRQLENTNLKSHRERIVSGLILSTNAQASVGLDLGGCPVAYPLPYGENLGETEVRVDIITNIDSALVIVFVKSFVLALTLAFFIAFIIIFVLAFVITLITSSGR